MQQIQLAFQEKIHSVLEKGIHFLLAVLFFLAICSLLRFLFGKPSQLRKAIAASLELACLYGIFIAAHTLDVHWALLPEKLPFLSNADAGFVLLPIAQDSFYDMAADFAVLLLMAFLLNLLHSFLPEGKRLRCLMCCVRIFLLLLIGQLLQPLLADRFPQGIGALAPVILLAAVVILILLGSLKLFVGAALFVSNPIIGALYTFFFSNLVGRALARAIVSSCLMVVLFRVLCAVNI